MDSGMEPAETTLSEAAIWRPAALPSWLGAFVARLEHRHDHAGDLDLPEFGAATPFLLVPAALAPALAARLGHRATFLVANGIALDDFANAITAAGGSVARDGAASAAGTLAVPVLGPDDDAVRKFPDLAIGAALAALDLARPLLPVGAAALRRRSWQLGGLPAVHLHFSAPAWTMGPSLPGDAGPERASAGLEQAADRAVALLGDKAPAPRDPLSMRAYGRVMSIAGRLAGPYLALRRRRGKEDPDRIGERRGFAGMTRDPGRWGWIHAASVGESVSVLPLAQQILKTGAADHLIVTTGTTTSAELLATRLPEQAVHQYVPLDSPKFVGRFLDHWRPEFALITESELWPNMFAALDARQIPAAIVNGRISRRSHAGWRRRPDLAAHMLRQTRICIAQTPTYARRFAELGAPQVVTLGNIKLDSPALPAVEGELERFRGLTRLRRVWLAASTHEGEEEMIADAHSALRDKFPDILTVLVPRHPARGEAIATMLEERWLATARRSKGAEARGAVDVYIADTIGELGLFYRLAPFAFIGGSLDRTGGHNPVEAALLNCAILHGPNVANFADMYETFNDAGGALKIADTGALVREIERLLTNPGDAAKIAAAARRVLEQNAGALDRVLEALDPVIRRPRSRDA